MKKSRFSEHQIIKILKEVEAGRTAKDVCREYGISNATYYAVLHQLPESRVALA